MSAITKRSDGVVVEKEKGSNRIIWPDNVVAKASEMGYRPFAGYWVRMDDDHLYTLEEIGLSLDE